MKELPDVNSQTIVGMFESNDVLLHFKLVCWFIVWIDLFCRKIGFL